MGPLFACFETVPRGARLGAANHERSAQAPRLKLGILVKATGGGRLDFD